MLLIRAPPPVLPPPPQQQPNMQFPTQYATISLPLLFTILQAVSGRPNAAPYVDLNAPLTLHDLHHLSQLSALTSGAGAKAAAKPKPAAGGAAGAPAPAGGAAEGAAPGGAEPTPAGGEAGPEQAPPQRRGLSRRDLGDHHAYLARRGHLTLRDLITKRSPFVDLDAPLTLHDLHHLSKLSAMMSGGGAKAALGGAKQKRALARRNMGGMRYGADW